MEFIHFEALDEDEYTDFNVEGKVSDDELSSVVDDSEANENVCESYRFDNAARSTESALEYAFIRSSRDLEVESDVINFYENSDNESPEVDEFENSNKKVSKIANSLLIPNGQDSNDSLLYSICYVVHFLKSGIIDTCDDKEMEEIIASDLYDQLNDEKEHLQLDLDY